ncbi:MAG TPA: M56 family metallopeptidase [Actinocrinis sp.]|jgi:hypothetical protein
MHLLAYLSLLFPLAAGPMARLVTARVEPRTATWLMSGAAVLLAGTSCGALGLLALASLVRIPVLARLGHWSLSVVAGGDPSTAAVSAIAGVLFGAALLAVVAYAVRMARALTEAFRQARLLAGPDSLVVTEDAAADAYAVPGRPGRIVVSAGMFDALDAPGRAALLAHEHAHLTGRHYMFTSAARLAAAANPLLRPLAGSVEYTVERWADERAAQEVGDRRLVAEAIAHAALATKASRPRRGPGAVLGAVFGRSADRALASAGPVPRRVAALLAPPPGSGAAVALLSLAFMAAALVCALQAADDLQDLLSLAHASMHSAVLGRPGSH